jgi:hypothetical protein
VGHGISLACQMGRAHCLVCDADHRKGLKAGGRIGADTDLGTAEERAKTDYSRIGVGMGVFCLVMVTLGELVLSSSCTKLQ